MFFVDKFVEVWGGECWGKFGASFPAKHPVGHAFEDRGDGLIILGDELKTLQQVGGHVRRDFDASEVLVDLAQVGHLLQQAGRGALLAGLSTSPNLIFERS